MFKKYFEALFFTLLRKISYYNVNVMEYSRNYCEVTFYNTGDFYEEARSYDACYASPWVGTWINVY